VLKGVSRYPESIGREEAPSAVNPPRLPRRQCASKWVASAAAIEAGSVCKWPPLPIGTETVVYGHALTRDLPMGGGGRQLEQDQRRRRSVLDVSWPADGDLGWQPDSAAGDQEPAGDRL